MLFVLNVVMKYLNSGNNYPKWASVNNSVFLCLKCAGKHKNFGADISLIRSLTFDSWDDKQIEYLKRGGNKRFKEFLNEFKIADNTEMEHKYILKATDYYRKLLASEINNEEPPYKPNYIIGLEELNNKATPFENFIPICDYQKIEKNFEENSNSGFFGTVGNLLYKTKDQIKNVAGVMGNKIKEMELGNKLKYTGEKSYSMAKVTGSFVFEKGKDVYNYEYYNKMKEGLNVITDKTKKILKKEKENETTNISYSSEKITKEDQSINKEIRENVEFKNINNFSDNYSPDQI